MAGFGRGGRGAALRKLLEEPPRKPGVSSSDGDQNGKNGGHPGAEASSKKPSPPPPSLSFGRGFATLSKEGKLAQGCYKYNLLL